jgi:hypothetical protein
MEQARSQASCSRQRILTAASPFIRLCHNLLIPAQNETAVRSLLRSVLSVPFGATGTDDFGTHPCLQPFRTTETKKDGDKYREINGLQVAVSAELFVYYLGHRPPRVNSE